MSRNIFFSVIGSIVFLSFSFRSNAVLIASQGFENEPAPSTGSEEFVDANTSSHALGDQVLENVVSPGLGGELSFAAFHTTTGSNGHNDGDDAGVHSASQVSFTHAFPASWPGTYTDASNNGYLLGDTDGVTTITFGTVLLTGHHSVVLTLDFLAMSADWESSDAMDVLLTTNLGPISLIDINDGDTLDLGTAQITEGVWSNLSINVPDAAGVATLQVTLEANDNEEAILFDNIQFSGTVIPEPSTAGLLFASSLGLLFRRRRDC